MAQPFWKVVWQYLVKLKMHMPYNPAISFLDIYSKAAFCCCFQAVIYDPLVDCEINLRVTINIFYKRNRLENIRVRMVL